MSEEKPKSNCWNCNKLVYKERTHNFVKKFGDKYYDVKIFRCPECKDDTCSLGESSWRPKI